MAIAYCSFDNRDQHFDNSGQPLFGRITFRYKDTSELAPTYGWDMETNSFISVTNPRYTDAYGKIPMTYLDGSIAYLVEYEKYKGTGIMASDNDTENWELQYTSDWMETIGSDIIAAGAFVQNIAELRLLDASSFENGTTVVLLGYATAGDKPIVSYRWNATSQINDNGGSVIQGKTTLGRWELVEKSEVDVRDFGLFGGVSVYEPTDVNSILTAAISYANSLGIDVFIPSGVYQLTGGSYLVNHRLHCADGVRFCAKQGTTTSLTATEGILGTTETLFVNNSYGSSSTGKISINVPEFYLGWIAGTGIVNFTHTATIYHLNENVPVNIPAGVKVIIETDFSAGLILDGCDVESRHRLSGQVSFKNMSVRKGWMKTDYDFNSTSYSITNCTFTLLDDWDADTYIILKNKQLDYVYGDMMEQTITNAKLGYNCVIENCYGTCSISGDAEIHNASLTITNITNNPSLNCVDSWLTIPNGLVTNLAIRRGMISGSIQSIGNVYLENTDLVAAADFSAANPVVLKNCNISGNMSCRRIELYNCLIGATISQFDNGGEIDFVINGCTFAENGFHSIASYTPGTFVKGRWLNNNALKEHPIIVNRTNLAELDGSHAYAYEGNSGKFLPRKYSHSWVTTNLVHYPTGVKNIGTGHLLWEGALVVVQHLKWWNGVYVADESSSLCKFFSVAKAMKTFRVTFTYQSDTTLCSDSMDPPAQLSQSYSGCVMYTGYGEDANMGMFNGKLIGGWGHQGLQETLTSAFITLEQLN